MTPIHWPNDLLYSVPYKPLISRVILQKEQWGQFYNRLSSEYRSKYDYDRYMWAMEMVRSRSFQGLGSGAGSVLIPGSIAGALLGAAAFASQQPNLGEVPPIILATLAAFTLVPTLLKSQEKSTVLLPVIDSSNHCSNNPSCTIDFEPSSSSFVMTALRDTEKDCEVTISYGDKSNDDLLQYFGFVEKNNENDEYIVTSQDLKDSFIVNRGDTSTWQIIEGDRTPNGETFSFLQDLLTAELVAMKERYHILRNKYSILPSSSPSSPGDNDPETGNTAIVCLVGLYTNEKMITLETAIKTLTSKLSPES